MARRSDTSLAALLLTQRLVDTDAAPLKASEYWRLLEVVADPAVLLARDAEGIASEYGLDGELAGRIAVLLGAASSFAFALDDASQSGMQVVASVDDDYPPVLRDRLGASAPPLLYAFGDLSLLQRDLLGVVGSRDVSPAAADVATAAAVAAVSRGWGVVSGGAKGVDRLAMGAALEHDGLAVGVLADSLVRATRDVEARQAVTDGRLCLCTPYKPTAGFSVASAMGRNKIIYALSRGTLVVASDHDTGGTWAGAREALRQSSAPVLVWTGEGAGPGNQPLVELGGLAVADAAAVVDDVVAAPPPKPDPSQLRLIV
jgi:predicted Rossmann fold nucleotide-binding protein DprA/Smf involved in DNA uptake